MTLSAGICLDPPERALVLCVDEKSQIQAPDRTQPLLPLRPGQIERRTHDHERHGTTTLFAALDVKAGTIVGKCMPRHRAQEFRKFLDEIERNDAHRPRHARVRVQHPEIKINHCLLLGGAPGIGRDFALEPLRQAVGPWNFQEVSPADVLGGWTYFRRSVICRVSEAHDLVKAIVFNCMSA